MNEIEIKALELLAISPEPAGSEFAEAFQHLVQRALEAIWKV